MQLRVGISGFSYPEWKGDFCPKKLEAGDMLARESDAAKRVATAPDGYLRLRERVRDRQQPIASRPSVAAERDAG